jgi:hypothetical protein
MRQDHGVDRFAIEREAIEKTPERSGLRTAIDEHATASILDQDCVTLADIENANDERRIAWICW